jgi:transcriptional regulator with XRE-family HTH domain
MMSTPVNGEVFTLLNMGTFKDRLAEAVADAKMTTAEARAALAKLGMTRSNLTHWFGGRAKEPKGPALTTAAELLGVNAVWLAKGEGEKRPTKENKKMSVKLMQLSQEAVDFAIMYDAMDPDVRELVRRHARDINEALGKPSVTNPFGKGKRRRGKSASKK